MAISLKPNHLQRYKDIVLFLVKYGQINAFEQTAIEQLIGNGHDGRDLIAAVAAPTENGAGESGAAPQSEQLLCDLEMLGPSFVKIGELLAMRPDCLPLPYIESLSKMKRHAQPVGISEVQQIIESEIKMQFSSAFQTVDETPLGISAFGQTHRGVLRDGSRVVIKVQKPGVQEQVNDDLLVLDELAQFLDEHTKLGATFGFTDLLMDLRKLIVAELDYRQEAQNLKTLNANLLDLDLIFVPEPREEYTTQRLLCLKYIEGRELADVHKAGLLKSERVKLAEQLYRAYLQQILLDGFVHVDVDPESIRLTDKGKLALLDIGVVARISFAMQEKLIQLALAINTGQAEHVVDVLLAVGQRRDNFDESGFRQAVTDLALVHRDANIKQIDLGRVILGIAQDSFKFGLKLPPELPMLGMTLLKLGQVAYVLDPAFDSREYVHRHLTEVIRGHVIKTFSPVNMFHGLIESVELLEKLPGKVAKILDSVANNDLKVTVHAIDENVLIGGFQKIANRITIGLVLAALIIGASMLMNIRTSFTIWGYPGLAIICFILAAGFGFTLVLEIMISDRRAH